MIQGFYSAASGLAAAQEHQEVIAQNLAHAAIPGYRRQELAFSSFEQTLSGSAAATSAGPAQGAQVSQSYTDFQPGDFYHTGNHLDCALRGDGFFVLQGEEGPVYTRNGTFQIGPNGQLRGAGGMPVSGTAGPITIPSNASDLRIGWDGSVRVNGAAVGQLRVVSFAQPGNLVRVGPTLFQAPPGTASQASSATVSQGYREGSNVQIANELVNMILGMRHYEAATNAMRSMSAAIQQQTRPS